MKKIILFIALFVGLGATESMAQNYNNWAVGLRVGEPLGLNVRKYFDSGTKNFDINVGTYGLLWGGDRMYRKAAYYQDNPAGLMVQGIFHWNKQLGSSEKFQVYYGFGGQVNQRKRNTVVGNNIAEKHISLGAVINGGLEYSLPDNNLSIFADLGLYNELAPKIFFMHVNSGIGLRLNLNR